MNILIANLNSSNTVGCNNGICIQNISPSVDESFHLSVQGICDANSNSLHYGKIAKLNTRCFYLGIFGTKSFVWDGHYSCPLPPWLLTPVINPTTNAKVTHIAHQKCYWEGIRFAGHVFIDWTLVEEISLVFPSKACDITVAGVV